MELMGRQPVQGLHHSLVGQLQGFGNGFALDHLRGHGGRGNGGATAKGVEFHVRNDVIFHLDIDLHNVAALGVAHLADAVGVVHFTQVPGVGEVIHDFFTVQHNQFLLSQLPPTPGKWNADKKPPEESPGAYNPHPPGCWLR